MGYSLSTSPKSTGTDLIRNKLANPAVLRSLTTERVASILERDLDATIRDWTALVEHDEELNRIPLGFQDRSEHLPELPNDLISRLPLPSLGKAPISIDAREHGTLRCEQGNTVAIVVGESRIVQVSIVNTLQKNLRTVDFSQGAGRYEHRRRSGFAIETGDAQLRGTRIRPAGGVGPQDLTSCGLGSAGLWQFAARNSTTRCCSSVVRQLDNSVPED